MPQDNTQAEPLIDIGLALAQESSLLDRFVAHRVFPTAVVGEEHGRIPRWMRRSRVETVKRNKDGTFNRLQSAVEDESYRCEEAGLEEALPDRDRRHFASAFDSEMRISRQLASNLLLSRDDALANVLFSTDTFGAGFNTGATGAWGHATASNPIRDVELAKDQVRKRIGVYPNRLLIGAGLWTKASLDPKILDQVKVLRAYAGDTMASRGRIALDALALAFGVDEVIVGAAVKDSAKEGQGYSGADVWADDFALLFYGPQSISEEDLALGRTFVWDDGLQGSDLSDATSIESDALHSFRVEKYREERVTSDIIRVRDYIDMKMLLKESAHLITGA
jgi:hypothetical protein